MFTKTKLIIVAAFSVTTGIALTASEETQRHPSIAGHGDVVQLPDAVDQPRDESKICVDATKGGPWNRINPAIEKVARFVNIYSKAGKSPATVRISVILHGDATLVALDNAPYGKRFDTDGNPNLPVLEKLRTAGVELLVCGQSLAHKGASHDDVAAQVEVAVSGLTVNVNRQQDGYAFLPLH